MNPQDAPLLFEELPLIPKTASIDNADIQDETEAIPTITIIVDGEPIPKGRARAYLRGGYIRFHTPRETVQYEEKIRAAARNMIGRIHPFDGKPIGMMVRSYLPIPASWSQKKQAAALRDELRPVGRPDADNYLKIACDALNGLLYRDDSLVTDMFVIKRYSDRPRMEIEVFT